MKISLKTVVVTGAGSGLGRAVAFGLAQHGVPVVCIDAARAGVEETAARIAAAGGFAEAEVLDITDAAAVATLFDRLRDSGRTADGLVTCAGITSKTGILDLTVEEWERVMAVNLRGTFLSVQGALRGMLAEGRGRIVTVASDVGKRGGGRLAKAAYGASKGGVILFTRSVARELAVKGAGIRINCLSPGPMMTQMHDGMTDAERRTVESSVPVGRFGEAEEVAAGALFLLSDAATFVYGETLSVDGGVVMD